MYSPTLPYYHSYNHYKINMLAAHYVQLRVVKEDEPEPAKSIEKKPYSSPKRNISCSQCGQQYHWCNCDLKEKEEK